MARNISPDRLASLDTDELWLEVLDTYKAGAVEQLLLGAGYSERGARKEVKGIARSVSTGNPVPTGTDYKGSLAATVSMGLAELTTSDEDKFFRTSVLSIGNLSHRLAMSCANHQYDCTDRSLITERGNLTDVYKELLLSAREYARQHLHGSEDVVAHAADQLYETLYLLLGRQAKEAYLLTDGEKTKPLRLPTLLNWANIVLFFDQHEIFWLQEIEVFRKKECIVGRADGIAISVDGHEPDEEQQATIAKIVECAKGNRPSVGKLLHEISAGLSGGDGRESQIEAVIIEHKFDVSGGKRGINMRRIPVQNHTEQVERYITFANLDDHLLDEDYDPKDGWPKNCRVVGGILYYWLHNQLEPVILSVSMSPADQDEFFWKHVVSQRWIAERVAKMRVITEAVRYHVGRMTGKSRKRAPSVRQLPLGLFLTRFQEAVEAFRRFDPSVVDPAPRVELQWHTRKEVIVQAIPLDTLMANAKFLALNPELSLTEQLQTGKYVCPFDHGEQRSLRIDMKSRTFHCSACSRSGYLQ